jgi:hypothetical protein
LGDVDGLRTEIEDLTEDGGELREGKEGQSKSQEGRGGKRTHAGQTETEEVHAEGVDGEGAEVEGVMSVEETEEGARKRTNGSSSSEMQRVAMSSAVYERVGRRRRVDKKR